jgi:hypothetical protein
MSKICLIMPYLGRIPPSFHLFLNGAIHNPGITIHWLTDQTYTGDLPPNVIMHKTTLEAIRDEAQRKLNTNISLNYAYKLCDLKPTTSIIFSHLIEGYDFWGWGDFDVIWGNLEGSVREKIDLGYDVITFHNLWLSGAFTLFRNVSLLNHAFERHPAWREILASNQHLSFGECSRRWDEHMKAGDLANVETDPPCFTRIIYSLGKAGQLKCSFEHRIKEWISPTEIIEVDHKERSIRSLEDGTEFPLFHWVLKSKWPAFSLPERDLPDRFYITREGFWLNRSQINTMARLYRRSRGEAARIARGIRQRAITGLVR